VRCPQNKKNIGFLLCLFVLLIVFDVCLVLTMSERDAPVNAFTLDPEAGEFVLSHANVRSERDGATRLIIVCSL
jgi:hypothetical protein